MNLQKQKIFFYKNIEEMKQLKKSNEIEILPFFIKKGKIIINIDFFKLSSDNKKIKMFFWNLQKENDVALIWKLSIKNILFYLEYFPTFEIIHN